MPPVLENQAGASQAALMRDALATLPAEPWTGDTLATWITGHETPDHVLRLALTGEDHGPDLADLLRMMTRDRAADRLRAAAA